MRLTLHRLLLLLLPLGMALGARGQVTLVTEDFSNDGETSNPVRYTTNTAALNTTAYPFSTTHYFMRSTQNAVRFPDPGGAIVFGLTASPGYIYSSPGVVAAAGFWASEAVRAPDGTGDRVP